MACPGTVGTLASSTQSYHHRTRRRMSQCGCSRSTCRWTTNLWSTVTLPSTRSFRTLAEGNTRGWILSNWRHCLQFYREPRTGEHGLQWNFGSKLTSVEKDRNNLGDTQPRTSWIICDSVPVCVAVDRSRPYTSTELLAFTAHKPKVHLSRHNTPRLHR